VAAISIDGRIGQFRQSRFMKRFLPRLLTAFLSTAILPALLSSVMAQDPCKLTDIGTGTAASVRDGRTLLLADGRELRLAAIEVADDSRGALQSLAYVGNSEQSVQQTLLEQGRARVSARTGSKACADLLLRNERAARAARRGLWADPNFAPLRSENLARIAAARGQFAIVEGKVLSVRESGATIYLNFGRRWTQDFTVIIPKRHRREFATAGLDPKRLEGNPIRVRGWIGQQSGPVIEVVNPEQIELVE